MQDSKVRCKRGPVPGWPPKESYLQQLLAEGDGNGLGAVGRS